MKKEIDSKCDIEGDVSSITKCIKSGAKVHDSVCKLTSWHKDMLLKYTNYNITVSAQSLEKSGLMLGHLADQIQVTVYTIDQVQRFKSWQKLFLIKDLISWLSFDCWLGQDTGKLHFLLDQKIVTSGMIQAIIQDFNEFASEGQTLDSCLTSYLVNGECPYADGHYIDLTYDDTVRSCPYARKGVRSKRGQSIESQFGIQTLPDRCKYMEFFGRTLNEEANINTTTGAKDTCIQNHSGSYVSRSYSEHRRRFSLWNQRHRPHGNSSRVN